MRQIRRMNTPRSTHTIRPGRTLPVLATALTLLAAAPVHAQKELSDASLEELMQMPVTSVAKKAQPLSDAAAAIHVITAEDIRRSGATRVAEALALAPGVEFAQLAGGISAVSIRGFNAQFSTKLLVLVDGRSIYSQLYSNVFWDLQNMMLEDIDRIEVIRGPGSTLWGANAVNGVINIITRSARDTIGGLATIAQGFEERGHANVRYGWRMGDYGAMRVFAKTEGYDQTLTANGRPAGDGYRSQRFGLRGDWELPQGDRITVLAEASRGDLGIAFQPTPLVPPSALLSPNGSFHGAFVLGRWQRALSLSSELSLQAYHDRAVRSDYNRIEEQVTDFELQHRTRNAERGDFVWGLHWRQRADLLQHPNTVLMDPEGVRQSMAGLYAQQEQRWLDGRLVTTVGARLEHGYWGTLDLQPNLRVLAHLGPDTRVWAAVSGAARSPARADVSPRIDLPGSGLLPGISVRVDPEFQSERVTTLELGVRHLFAKAIAVDATLYANRYRKLLTRRTQLTFAPFLANVTMLNGMEGDAHGAEVSATWAVTPHWRLNGHLAVQRLSMHDLIDPGSDFERSVEGASPRTQLSVASRHELAEGWSFDARARYVGALTRPYNDALAPERRVPSYVDLTMYLGWRVNRQLELALIGRRLAAASRLEFVPESGLGVTRPQRSVMLRGTVKF